MSEDNRETKQGDEEEVIAQGVADHALALALGQPKGRLELPLPPDPPVVATGGREAKETLSKEGTTLGEFQDLLLVGRSAKRILRDDVCGPPGALHCATICARFAPRDDRQPGSTRLVCHELSADEWSSEVEAACLPMGADDDESGGYGDTVRRKCDGCLFKVNRVERVDDDGGFRYRCRPLNYWEVPRPCDEAMIALAYSALYDTSTSTALACDVKWLAGDEIERAVDLLTTKDVADLIIKPIMMMDRTDGSEQHQPYLARLGPPGLDQFSASEDSAVRDAAASPKHLHTDKDEHGLLCRRATHFFSWTFQQLFAHFVEIYYDFVHDSPELTPDSAFAYVSLTAIDQSPDHMATMKSVEWVEHFLTLVASIKHTVLFFSPWVKADPLQRYFCLLELFVTHDTPDAKLTIQMPASQRAAMEAVKNGSADGQARVVECLCASDVRDAGGRDDDEKEMIMGIIKRRYGGKVDGFTRVNDMVQCALNDHIFRTANVDSFRDHSEYNHLQLHAGFLLRDLQRYAHDLPGLFSFRPEFNIRQAATCEELRQIIGELERQGDGFRALQPAVFRFANRFPEVLATTEGDADDDEGDGGVSPSKMEDTDDETSQGGGDDASAGGHAATPGEIARSFSQVTPRSARAEVDAVGGDIDSQRLTMIGQKRAMHGEVRRSLSGNAESPLYRNTTNDLVDHCLDDLGIPVSPRIARHALNETGSRTSPGGRMKPSLKPAVKYIIKKRERAQEQRIIDAVMEATLIDIRDAESLRRRRLDWNVNDGATSAVVGGSGGAAAPTQGGGGAATAAAAAAPEVEECGSCALC